MRSMISGKVEAVTAESVAEAALRGDALQLRSLAQELLRMNPVISEVPRPQTEDLQILGTAAALVELLALRAGQPAPEWTRLIGSVPNPTFLVRSAERMRHLRELCLAESPDPLRKRGLYAPPDFLSFA